LIELGEAWRHGGQGHEPSRQPRRRARAAHRALSASRIGTSYRPRTSPFRRCDPVRSR